MTNYLTDEEIRFGLSNGRSGFSFEAYWLALREIKEKRAEWKTLKRIAKRSGAWKTVDGVWVSSVDKVYHVTPEGRVPIEMQADQLTPDLFKYYYSTLEAAQEAPHD